MATDTDSQSPLFWERLYKLFASSDRRGEEPRQPMVIAVCVVISVTLWASLTLQEQKTVTLEAPTEVVNVPADEALTQLPPSTVRVQLRGPGLQLMWLLMDPPTVTVDVSNDETMVAEALGLSNQSDVRIESVNPQRIALSKEPKVERRIPVQSRVQINLPPAHELIQPPRVRPESIAVTGAESVVQRLQYWPTDSLAVDNLRDSLETSIPLADTLAQLVTRNIDAVTLIARVGKFAEAQREIDVEVTGVPADQSLVALEPSTIRVRYRVLFDQLFESQRVNDFFASVSYSQIRSDTTGYVEPRLHVPSNMIIRDPEPIPRRLRYYTFVTE